MIFKGSGCFQFPEAVFTSTAKKAYALQNGDHYKLYLFYRSRTAVYSVTNFGSEGKPML